ncbi:phosphotransferase family protein [Microlunatus soli]|uniref:Phosphotransferase enzyme family protein n=1 Tax=Microlunatus soli TaxID=630515 RepID=A0A1H1S9I8_9ACTN|nr:phosphotransferase [Microlunatus soli]SDS44632.1 Phosphotransferase enzyme family protein [Microlunatus soli]
MIGAPAGSYRGTVGRCCIAAAGDGHVRRAAPVAAVWQVGAVAVKCYTDLPGRPATELAEQSAELFSTIWSADDPDVTAPEVLQVHVGPRHAALLTRWMPWPRLSSGDLSLRTAVDRVRRLHEIWGSNGQLNRVRCHGDLHPGNLLAADNGTAFVDFDLSTWDLPERDLAQLVVNFGGPDDFEKVRGWYGLDPDQDRERRLLDYAMDKIERIADYYRRNSGSVSLTGDGVRRLRELRRLLVKPGGR